MTASALTYQPPLGRVLVAAVGVTVILVGLYQLHAAYKAKFRDALKRHRMRRGEEFWTTFAGRVGTTARALALAVAGAFVLVAAYQSDPRETRGLGGALSALAGQPFGPYLLGIVALGLLAFGLFMFVVARYRRIDPA